MKVKKLKIDIGEYPQDDSGVYIGFPAIVWADPEFSYADATKVECSLKISAR